MLRSESLHKKIIAIIMLLCIIAAFSSCRNDDELHFRDYIADKNVTGLELLLNRFESTEVRWYVAYGEDGNNSEWVEEKEVAPFDDKDYKFFSSLPNLENLYICLGDDTSAYITNKVLSSIPDAQYIGFAWCPNADFSVLKEHKGFNDVAFTNHCDLTTLPVLDAKLLGLSGCSNIPWQVISEMKNVESIRYSGKETLSDEAFELMSKMQSLKILYYNAVPYDNWNWGEGGEEYTQPPYKITSMDEVEEWIYKSIDKDSIEVFLGSGERTLVLFPYAETNPGE